MRTLFFIFILLSSFLHATIINVPADQPTIQDGITASANGDTVLVQPGTYVENINYNGKLITVGSLFLTTQDSAYISSTIIDGNNSGKVVIFENGEDSTAVLCGFTITNGLASGSYPDDCGGGIYCYYSSPSLENITIVDNLASYGGGIYNYRSSPSLENVTISGNSAGSGSGGGIYCYNNSSPSLENVTVIGNSASVGGGIQCQHHSNPFLQNVTIISNSGNYGGGITCSNSSNPILFNVTITGNSASGTYGYGGGIYCIDYSSPSLENVTITGNSANHGGGIYCWNNASPSLINSILWNDTPQEIYFYEYSTPSSITISYSDIQGGEAGIITNNTGTVYWLEGNIDSDPLFVDPGNDDYHLQSFSPCIDAGDPASPLDPDGTIVEMGTYYYDQILNPISPIADFTADTINGEVPLTVNFTNLSTPGTGVIDEWYWEFGDGNNSSLQNPSNEYQLPGIYTVSLTVTDVNNSTDTETKVDYITVYALPYSGPVWHISTTGSDITGNGSEQFPFATIQLGIDFSADTDTVLVQPGTYVENINYNGKLITVGSLFLTTQDTSYISSTIIDGNNIGKVVIFENSEDSTAVLCGFTITNGLATGSSPANCGGGIYCDLSNPTLERLTITGNFADYGGGIFFESSSSSLEEIAIIGNTATDQGGGIFCFDSDLSLYNIIIMSNVATNDGGGILCQVCDPILDNVTISNNTAGYGGGISCRMDSNPSLKNLTITGNSVASGSLGYGGGIVCFTFSDPILDNVIISDNIADYGGGIYCGASSDPILENVTISSNSASDGGGIYCYNSTPVLINSILWNDSPQEIYIESGSVTTTYSDIQGSWAGTGNINSDPLFVDSGNDNYNLIYTSPCIDTGDPLSSLDPDSSRADMGACYFDKSIGAPAITAVTDVPNDQGRSVIVTWQRSIWDEAFSTVPIVNYNLWEKYPYELDRECTITNDINKAIEEQDTYFQREDTTWVNIANVSAMQWEQYSTHAVTYLDSTIAGDYLSYFFVSAHTPSPWIYFSSSVESGYSVDNIAPDETRVYIAQNGSNIGLSWDEVEYGTFQGNSYLEINGIWYKIYAGDSPDFVCDEAHLIGTVTDLNYDYPLSGEEKKFFKIVVSDQPEAGRTINRSAPLSKGRKPRFIGAEGFK